MPIFPSFRLSQTLFTGLLLIGLSACSPEASNTDGQVAANTASAANAASRSRMPSDPALKSLYIQSCYGCHSAGAAGAPRSGNRDQWAPRLQKGLEGLLANTKSGINSMPPKGMCVNCSDDDFRALILFLAGEAK
ncbi:MAG: c-type cytochrome [Zhongshania sp.]|uniref:c-type cytochrome n=1 Tax=Zhongshania sp. TaxID=1971902 RepID=UPI002613A2F3|nr:c-type cytochrome [Zhongshania sp.]MDF1692532.1 c-type cytochrome [Zhongshania sp.]